VAKYKDIAADLSRRIFEGEFPVGDRLPAILDLADQYDVAINTIRAAEKILQDEGLIRITPSEPVIVVKTPDYDKASLLDKLREMERVIGEAISMVEEST
jgi:GntR family transcriptional regulator